LREYGSISGGHRAREHLRFAPASVELLQATNTVEHVSNRTASQSR
jgi:hypothetical protein